MNPNFQIVQNPTQPNSNQPANSQFSDPNALAIVRTIGMNENNGSPTPQDYTKRGASGEYGMYQFTKDAWNNYADQVLGDSHADPTPTNQNAVIYGMSKRWLSEGWTPQMILSQWNGGGAYDYQTGDAGVNPKGVRYNVKQYVDNGMNYYNQESRKLGVTPIADTSANTNQTEPFTPSKDIFQNIKSGNIGGALGNVINFAFPVLSDAGNLLAGKSNKTWLQLLGDAGLSVLPFIPLAGEAGEAARAGMGVEELGAEAAKGLIPKLLGNTAVKGGLLGYGGGVAANLSQGQGIGQAITPNLTNVLGAAGGAALPTALSALKKGAVSLAGISPALQKILNSTDTLPSEMRSYLDAATAHKADLTADTPIVKAADELDKAKIQIGRKLNAAGREVGAAKVPLTKIKLGVNFADSQGSKNVLDRINEQTGLTFNAKGNPIALKGRSPSISSTDANRLADVWKRIQSLKATSSVRQLADTIDAVDNNIHYAKTQTPKGFDPIKGLMFSIRDDLNNALSHISPTLAEANRKFSALKGINDEVIKMAGPQNQRGTLLLKRVFSGDKQGEVQDLFGEIKKLTGVDLTKHAALAAIATQAAGDKTEKGLLQQSIEGALNEGAATNPTAMLYNFALKKARNIFTNPAKTAMRLAQNPAPQGLMKELLTRNAGAGIGTRLGAASGPSLQQLFSQSP